jgi:4-diphosphocytidyl-2-C-methyl-D-erythritol kinase
VGLRIGADVPFCLTGGTALGEGTGEILDTLPPPPPHYLVVAKPVAGAETAGIYRAYDEQRPEEGVPSAAPVVEALRAGDLAALARSLGNDLAPATKSFVPEVRVLEKELQNSGSPGVAMSGSGTAVFGMFASEAEARAVAEELRAAFVCVCNPVARSVEIL